VCCEEEERVSGGERHCGFQRLKRVSLRWSGDVFGSPCYIAVDSMHEPFCQSLIFRFLAHSNSSNGVSPAMGRDIIGDEIGCVSMMVQMTSDELETTSDRDRSQ
jgi:hypothetical protein